MKNFPDGQLFGSPGLAALFDLAGLRCDSVEHWKFDGMLEWQKIKRLLEGPEGYVH